MGIKSHIKHKLINVDHDDFMALKIDTNIGPVIIATTYLPPRREEIPLQHIMSLIRRPIPVYVAGDFNAHHNFLGYNYRNPRGRMLHQLILQGHLQYLGPNFKTLANGTGKPDLIFANRHANFNYHITQGSITSSDHLPIIWKIASTPIKLPQKPRPNLKLANWNCYRESITADINNLPQGMHETNNVTAEIIDQRIEVCGGKGQINSNPICSL